MTYLIDSSRRFAAKNQALERSRAGWIPRDISTENGYEGVTMRLLARKCTFPIAALGVLGLIAALVWWVNVSPANAQVPTHVFKGKVIIDGRPAPDGTLVVALIDGYKGKK